MVQFDGTSSHDNDCAGQKIVKWEWDWDNNGTFSDEGSQPWHQYLTGGKHQVQLRVTDDEGTTATLATPLSINILDDFIVTFPDANLDHSIREIINQPAGDIWKHELDTITQISLSTDGIADLTGMEYVWNPTVCHLDYNHFQNISPLRNMLKLTYLNITKEAEIPDISPLKGITQMVELHVASNWYTNLDAVSGMTNLSVLDASSCAINDISGLKNLNYLTNVDLSDNYITDVSPLAGHGSLEILNLDSNKISDINVLGSLPKLNVFEASDNKDISDISFLQRIDRYIPARIDPR